MNIEQARNTSTGLTAASGGMAGGAAALAVGASGLGIAVATGGGAVLGGLLAWWLLGGFDDEDKYKP